MLDFVSASKRQLKLYKKIRATVLGFAGSSHLLDTWTVVVPSLAVSKAGEETRLIK